MKLENGYEMKTTFWEDFSIADASGEDAVVDIYKRAFKEWKKNYIYLTELVIVLNRKIWQWHEKNKTLAKVYNNLWKQADEYACENLKGKEASFFYKITD